MDDYFSKSKSSDFIISSIKSLIQKMDFKLKYNVANKNFEGKIWVKNIY